MKRYDRSLIEVWKWKEKVYHDVKDLSTKEYIERIKEDATKILAEGKIELKTISLKREREMIL